MRLCICKSCLSLCCSNKIPSAGSFIFYSHEISFTLNQIWLKQISQLVDTEWKMIELECSQGVWELTWICYIQILCKLTWICYIQILCKLTWICYIQILCKLTWICYIQILCKLTWICYIQILCKLTWICYIQILYVNNLLFPPPSLYWSSYLGTVTTCEPQCPVPSLNHLFF